MQKGNVLIFLLIGIVILTAVGTTFYLNKSDSTKVSSAPYVPNPLIFPVKSTPSSTPQSSLSDNDAANWKIFTSKTEGFTLRYPPDWTIEDTSSGNCGHKSGTPSYYGYCRDRFNFVSPDRLRVGYAIFSDENKDRLSCGTQGPCDIPDIRFLETLDIPNFGQVYLVSYTTSLGGNTNHIRLHQPIDSGTIPTIGENKHSGYDIWFSLPSKTGGRFSLDVSTNTADNQNSKWTGMSYEKFYNSDSAQKAIKILKSLTYQ